MLLITDKNYKCLPGIYIIQNILTGKEYIGESLNIRRRMLIHGNHKTSQLIHRAIRKYGILNFRVYCEYYPNFNKLELLDIEEEMMIRYNTVIPNGYNVSIGIYYNLCGISRHSPKPTSHGINVSKAKSGVPLSANHRQELSKAHTGKKLSLSHKESIKKSLEKYKGVPIPPERREKIKNNRTDNKSVLQYDKNDIFICEHLSIRDAERMSGAHNSKITEVCKNKRKSAGGFKWKYKNNN